MCVITCSNDPLCKNNISIRIKKYSPRTIISMLASKGWYLIEKKWCCPNCFENINKLKEESNQL